MGEAYGEVDDQPERIHPAPSDTAEPQMKPRNLKTSLRCSPLTDPMREFDALPPPLRHWLSEALLPWSPRSVRKMWARALVRSCGNPAVALAALDRAELKTLARDVPKIWGKHHPGASTDLSAAAPARELRQQRPLPLGALGAAAVSGGVVPREWRHGPRPAEAAEAPGRPDALDRCEDACWPPGSSAPPT